MLAGKHVRASHDWFCFYLDDKVAKFLRQSLSVVMQNQSNTELLSTFKGKPLKNCKKLQEMQDTLFQSGRSH